MTWQERAAALWGRGRNRAPAGVEGGGAGAGGSLPHRARWIGAVFLLALAVRVVYILEIDASPLFAHPAVDSLTYTQHAERLAAGNWLGRGGGPFWQPPLYPYLLGVLKTLFPGSFFYVVRLVQALLGALTCALIYWLGRQVARPAVAAAAAVATTLCGPLIFFDGELLPASLATFLDLAGLALLWRALQRPSGPGFLGAGLVFGLAAQAVPTVLTFVPVAAAWIGWRLRDRGGRRAAIWAGLFLLGSALTIAPVSLRNAAIGGDRVLISYNAGINFYVGNNSDYDSTVNARPGLEWDRIVGLARKAGIHRPSHQSRFFLARSWDYIGSQPLDYISLLARKLFLFWHGDEIGRNQDIYFWRNYSTVLAATLWKWGLAFPFGVIAPLALLGLLLSGRRQELVLFAAFVGVYCLSVVAFFPTARYRAPLLPLLVFFATLGACWICAGLRARQYGRAGLALAVVAVFAAAVNHRLSPMDMAGNAAIHYNLGTALGEVRELEQAQRELERAVELDSTYWQAWLNLGSVLGVRGNLPEAARIFERVLQESPDQAKIWLNLAHARRALGERPAALAAYEGTLRANPRERRVYLELIDYHLEVGDEIGAEGILERAATHLPRDAKRLRYVFGLARDRYRKGRIRGPEAAWPRRSD